MPRMGREKSETRVYHIILRGVNKQTIFEEREDGKKFLSTLAEYKKDSGYKIYAYCLMSNHIHLLIKEENEALEIIMRRIGARFVYWYNYKYERTGHLFQDRYKSEAVEDEAYLMNVVRYIHQNPLKAGIVDDIKDYKWSSYQDYMNNKGLTDTDFVLGHFDVDQEKSKALFETFHKKESDVKCLEMTERRRIKDSEAIGIIKKLCHVNHCMDLQNIHSHERSQSIKLLKDGGLSTRQISRLTGISRYIILKA